MGAMYHNKKWNVATIAVSLVALILVGDSSGNRPPSRTDRFLRSMIPHHAGAILMCEQAPINDPEIKELCVAIVSSQRSEIAQMRAKLDELER